MHKIIKLDKSIIVALDMPDLDFVRKVVDETSDVDGIGGYKIGSQLALAFGIRNVVEVIRKNSDLAVIYDHQKAGTDIPDIADNFMKSIRGVDAVILFPITGIKTENSWIKAAKKERIGVIVGGEMTHKNYFDFIKEDAPEKIYTIAKSLGINDFVVPGTKPDKIKEYRKLLGEKAVFYSPGLITQGGDLSEAAKAAGSYWHAIIGRAIYQSPDIRGTAKELVKVLK